MAAQLPQNQKSAWSRTLAYGGTVVALCLIHIGLLGYGAKVHSPSIDEVAHLPAGIAHWKFARFDLYEVNPPLVRLIAALPPLAVGLQTPWHNYSDEPGRRAEFRLGNDLIRANGLRSFRLFTWARWACIPFSLVGAWVVYRWSRELFGPCAALAALAMWCFSPNILAHGQMITPDVTATSLGVLCCWRLWHWTMRPTWRNTLWFGLALGLVALTKFTWVILGPLIFVMWGVKRYGRRREQSENRAVGTVADCPDSIRLGKRIIRLGGALLIAHQLILLGYGYDRVGRPLGEFEFVSDMLRPSLQARIGNIFSGTWLGKLPVPLPACYVEGIDVQKQEFSRDDRPSYLAGEFRYPGWWYYYLYALAIKVPLGFWIIGVLAVGSFLRRDKQRVSWRDHAFLLLPAAVILVLVSSQTGINRHMRYVLPCFPFAFIWIGQAFTKPSLRSVSFCVVCVALGWAIVSSLWIYPHSLSYFNEVVGGPRGGHKHVINSNIDWGQDLLMLREWVLEHPEQHDISIAYFGGVYATAAGLPGGPPPPGPLTKNLLERMPHGPQPGWYAVSVNYLYRLYPQDLRAADGRLTGVRCDYSYFLEFEPVQTIGYSIYIYHITPEEAEAVRERIWAEAIEEEPSLEVVTPEG